MNWNSWRYFDIVRGRSRLSPFVLAQYYAGKDTTWPSTFTSGSQSPSSKRSRMWSTAFWRKKFRVENFIKGLRNGSEVRNHIKWINHYTTDHSNKAPFILWIWRLMETFQVMQLELFKNNSGSILPPKASRSLESFNILEKMLLLVLSLKLLWTDTAFKRTAPLFLGFLYLMPSPKARHPGKGRRLETKIITACHPNNLCVSLNLSLL